MFSKIKYNFCCLFIFSWL